MVITGVLMMIAGGAFVVFATESEDQDKGVIVLMIGMALVLIGVLDMRIERIEKQLNSPGIIQQVGPCDS